MNTTADNDLLEALKTAYCFMPNLMDITQYEYGDQADRITGQVEFVRGVLQSQGIDPDEVADEINPDDASKSCY